MLGECQAIFLSNNDWGLIRPCPLVNLSEFQAIVKILGEHPTESICQRLIDLVVIHPQGLKAESLTSKDLDIKAILETALILNQGLELPEVINSEPTTVNLPSSGNSLVDLVGQFLSVFPDGGMALVQSEGVNVIRQLIWRHQVTSKYDDYLAAAKKEQSLKEVADIATKLDSPKGREFLRNTINLNSQEIM